MGIPTNIFKKDETQLEKNIGKITLRAWGKYAKPHKPENTYDELPKTYIFQVMPFMLRGYFKKLAKPNPFFDDNGNPVSEASPIEKKSIAV